MLPITLSFRSYHMEVLNRNTTRSPRILFKSYPPKIYKESTSEIYTAEWAALGCMPP